MSDNKVAAMTPLTPDEIALAKKLDAEATAGPWGQCRNFRSDVNAATGERVAVASFPSYKQLTSDATFIAAARTLLPKAIAEVEALRTELSHGRNWVGSALHNAVVADLEDARAENAAKDAEIARLKHVCPACSHPIDEHIMDTVDEKKWCRHAVGQGQTTSGIIGLPTVRTCGCEVASFDVYAIPVYADPAVVQELSAQIHKRDAEIARLKEQLLDVEDVCDCCYCPTHCDLLTQRGLPRLAECVMCAALADERRKVREFAESLDGLCGALEESNGLLNLSTGRLASEVQRGRMLLETISLTGEEPK